MRRAKLVVLVVLTISVLALAVQDLQGQTESHRNSTLEPRRDKATDEALDPGKLEIFVDPSWDQAQQVVPGPYVNLLSVPEGDDGSAPSQIEGLKDLPLSSGGRRLLIEELAPGRYLVELTAFRNKILANRFVMVEAGRTSQLKIRSELDPLKSGGGPLKLVLVLPPGLETNRIRHESGILRPRLADSGLFEFPPRDSWFNDLWCDRSDQGTIEVDAHWQLFGDYDLEIMDEVFFIQHQLDTGQEISIKVPSPSYRRLKLTNTKGQVLDDERISVFCSSWLDAKYSADEKRFLIPKKAQVVTITLTDGVYWEIRETALPMTIFAEKDEASFAIPELYPCDVVIDDSALDDHPFFAEWWRGECTWFVTTKEGRVLSRAPQMSLDSGIRIWLEEGEDYVMTMKEGLTVEGEKTRTFKVGPGLKPRIDFKITAFDPQVDDESCAE